MLDQSKTMFAQIFTLFKRLHWFEWILIAVVMGVHIYAALSAPHNFPMRWFVRDDAYYYFKVAQNISEGRGSTFDGINPTNGYHPLWLLICVPIFALARFDLILPLRVLLVVMAALSVGTSILLFRLLKEPLGEAVAMLAAAFWSMDLTIHEVITQQGLESGLVAFSMVLFLYLLQQQEKKERWTPGDFVKLGLVALFVLFSRLDGIYLAMIAGIWIIFRRTPIRYFVPLELAFVLGLIVGAYIQRVGIKSYLSIYSTSAIVMSALTFSLQTLLFFFAGLYQHPREQSGREILARTLVGVTSTAFFSGIIMILIRILKLAHMPLAVPLIYWGGMIPLTLGTRFGLRALSLRKEKRLISSSPKIFDQLKSRFRQLQAFIPAGVLYYGTLAAGLLTYMAINYSLFGTVMPVSGQIKRWWGTLSDNVYVAQKKTVSSIYTLDPIRSASWGLLTQPLYALAEKLASSNDKETHLYWGILTIMVATWLFLLLRQHTRTFPRIFQIGFIPLFISAWIHAFLYNALDYAAAHEWYWTSQMLSIVLAGALGTRSLLDLLPRHRAMNFAIWAATGVVTALLSLNFASGIIRLMPYHDRYQGQPYLDVLTILEGYTEEGAYIGMTGGGSVGYFIRNRTVVNMDGLINSYAYFQALKAGQASHYLESIGLDYVFANPYILTHTAPYKQQFRPEQFVPVPGAPKYGQKELLKFYPLGNR